MKMDNDLMITMCISLNHKVIVICLHRAWEYKHVKHVYAAVNRKLKM